MAILVVAAADAASALVLLKKSSYGQDAKIIGTIVDDFFGKTVLYTSMKTLRTLGILSSDPLPRIC
jgi:hydrogenase maturation factor